MILGKHVCASVVRQHFAMLLVCPDLDLETPCGLLPLILKYKHFCLLEQKLRSYLLKSFCDF